MIESQNHRIDFESKSIESIRVCGIIFSYNEQLAHKPNITNKITNLAFQIKRSGSQNKNLPHSNMLQNNFEISKNARS